MKPVVFVDEMRRIDRDAPVDEDVLIGRAGWAVARAARRMLGGAYGRRVVVIAGPGNNGADGRVAAEHLRRTGARVRIEEPTISDAGPCDLVIDGAFGTGFRRTYQPPDTHGAPVLAVDIPSGVNGDTGAVEGNAVRADVTVTFAALKPGLLFGRGPEHSGAVEVVDIGLDTSTARIHLVEAGDVVQRLPSSHRDTHKWKAAVLVIAGSPGMMGAATFAAQGAQRAGAGMVRLGSPGLASTALPVGEAVAVELPSMGWEGPALQAAERVGAAVIGPGLGRSDDTVASVRAFAERVDLPLLIDGDGLFAFGDGDGLELLGRRESPTVLTPHDGEFQRLSGSGPGADRISAARLLASESKSVVLLKGSTTVVADPEGEVLVSDRGGPRLATAGTGDVLSGMTGAFLAGGMQPPWAAAGAAFVHGAASHLGFDRGLVAGDLPHLVAQWLSHHGPEPR